jgi:hypothetical protein
MPPRKRQQSSAMLVALVTFVILFIAATIAAVVFYVKAEDYRTAGAALQTQIEDLASGVERQKLGATVGTKPPRTSWLATMLDNMDQAVTLILGGVAPDTSAEVKLKSARAEVARALNAAQQNVDLENAEPNDVGLTRIIHEVAAELGRTIDQRTALSAQIQQLRDRFDDALAASAEKEKVVQEEKGRLEQKVNEITDDYNELKILLEQTSDQRAQAILTQLDQARNDLKNLNQELLKTQAELQLVTGMMRRAQEQVAMIKPPPDSNVAAHRPDAEVILINDQAGVVHISIGSDDRVYRGLTFTVYDRSGAIPSDGKGKAEIEVFDIAKKYSAARIITADEKSPVLLGDSVANVIWDSDRTNVFVVTGEFDLNNDGAVDVGASTKIVQLIEKWGARVAPSMSVDTDFLVLGSPPQLLPKPTLEDLDLDPRAMAKYEASLARANQYRQILSSAEALWIPILNYDRFLYLVGYKGQIGKAGAF